ncbi:1-phosphofructokinase family hexose kinase [Nisaea sp.]|uniref:1-phosphofructokinase family hexose kinase n=1 Tax=Nisaea sp. TaxID=2024842 RepID=UPI002B275347|nr:1-phosphofructokinase family hexose kinase [Nisaea sp.]
MTGGILTLTMNPAVDVSAVTDHVVPTNKLRCRDASRDSGGGGINVARVIGRLGGACRAIYTAGGALGQQLRDILQEQGVDSIAIDVAAETRESFSVTEARSGAQYRFVLPGEALDRKDWQACIDTVATYAEPHHYVVASGSLPPGAPDDLYARLAEKLSDQDVRLVVDSSGPALGAALRHGIHMAKPNLQELRDLTGAPLECRADWEEAATGLVRDGRAEILLLTLGEEGAFLVTRDLRVRADAVPVKAISAVGAGDSFLAAMVWRLVSGDEPEAAFRYAIAAGSAALLTPGTDLCHKEDVERLLDQVRTKRIDVASIDSNKG